jgi:hypothetical protein
MDLRQAALHLLAALFLAWVRVFRAVAGMTGRLFFAAGADSRNRKSDYALLSMRLIPEWRAVCGPSPETASAGWLDAATLRPAALRGACRNRPAALPARITPRLIQGA